MIVDVGPGMVLFFVDGKLCDGGVAQRIDKQWSAGWRLLPPNLGLIRGAKDRVAIGRNVAGGRVHGHALFVSQLVGNWRHGSSSQQ